MPGTLSQFPRKGRPVGIAEGEVGSARKNVPGARPVGGEGRLLKGCVTFQLLHEGQVGNRNSKQRGFKEIPGQEKGSALCLQTSSWYPAGLGVRFVMGGGVDQIPGRLQ